MKKSLQLLLICILFTGYAKAQNKSWRYDFGTSTTVENLSNGPATGILSSNYGDDNVSSLLPAPADEQIARVWTGNRAAPANSASSYLGGFSLVPTAGNNRLRMGAAATASTHKFSILNIAGESVMSVGYKLKFNAGTSGDYTFSIGTDKSKQQWDKTHADYAKTPISGGTQFSHNTNFNDINSNLPAILIMHWRAMGSTYKLSVREKKSTQAIGGTFEGFRDVAVLNPTITFENNKEYDIQVYANSSAGDKTYTKNEVLYTIASRSSHIWIDDKLLLFATNNYNFKDVDNTGLPTDGPLNAFMFLSLNNTNKDAEVELDNFVYANYLEDINVLPVVLDGFSATKQNNSVSLNWKTLSEKDNSKFEVFRSGDVDQISKLIKTVTGKGNTSTLTNYSTVDNSPLIGNNYYKLVQIDFNGKADTLATASAKMGFAKSDFNVYAESTNSVRLSINSLSNETATLEIYNLSGQRLVREKLSLTEGANQVIVPAKLGSGVYVAVLKTKEDQFKTKFISK